jgi:hypothetical protein
MARILVIGGRQFSRVPTSTPHHEANARIARATREREHLTSLLDDIHTASPIELVLHFSHRGGEHLAAQWARRAGVEEKSPRQAGSKSPPLQGVDACARLLQHERIDIVLRLPDVDSNEYVDMDEATKHLNLETRYVEVEP